MKSHALALLILILFASGISFSQDSAAYRAATGISQPSEKIQMLEKFARDFPSSKLNTKAYDALFDLYVEQGNESRAVSAASRSLQTLAPENRMGPYNRFAYSLGLRGIGLDSALAWIQLCIEISTKSAPRSLAGFQDTKAYVLYKMGRNAEAETLQRIAIKGHENDPEYLSHLALYEHDSGNVLDALKTMSRALYYGGDEGSKDQFLAWIKEREKDQTKQNALKHSAVMSAIHSAIDTLNGDELIAARSNAAKFMADLLVDLPAAHNWAEEAVRSLKKKSQLSDVIAFKLNAALVLAAQDRLSESLTLLLSIEEIVDPYETKYWLTLGKAYQQRGETTNAAHAYMNGLVPRNDKQLRSALEEVYPTSGIDKALDSLRLANTQFEAGKYGKATTPNGKVILAELFTGAECGPCASSDVAVDAIANYYPRTAVAILEYHVHIPGPDPMTTNESWEKYKSYSVQGTPTIVVDGRESIIGGGPKTVARNRFGVYRYAIQKFESEKPQAALAIHIRNLSDKIAVRVDVEKNKSLPASARPTLHIALVERSVDYTGSNGIAKHAFVVRHLNNGASGVPVSKRKETIESETVIADLEKQQKEFLDNPTAQPSWTSRRPFTGWKSRPEKIDRTNLAIVAWLQDETTREVFQAVYADVPASVGAEH